MPVEFARRKGDDGAGGRIQTAQAMAGSQPKPPLGVQVQIVDVVGEEAVLGGQVPAVLPRRDPSAPATTLGGGPGDVVLAQHMVDAIGVGHGQPATSFGQRSDVGRGGHEHQRSDEADDGGDGTRGHGSASDPEQPGRIAARRPARTWQGLRGASYSKLLLQDYGCISRTRANTMILHAIQ